MEIESPPRCLWLTPAPPFFGASLERTALFVPKYRSATRPIGGEWVEAHSGKTIDVFDPATARKIGTVAEASEDDVNRAVGAARRALESGPWADMSPAGRQQLIWRLAELIDQNSAEFAEIESIDNGKTRFIAGTVWVNCHNLVDPNMPFGGYKQSGVGREHGRVAVEMYTEAKSVCMQL